MNINELRVFNATHRLKITEEEFKDIQEEQEHTERAGLSIKCVKKGKIIGISHDQKHIIIIKEVKGNITIKPHTMILFKTLINFEDLPDEIYTLHSIASYRSLDTDIKYVAQSMDGLKDRICDRFIDKYPKQLGECGKYWSNYDSEKEKKIRKELVEKQIKAIFWLFGEKVKIDKLGKSRQNVAKIIKVFQRNNRRLAIFQEEKDYQVERSCGFYGGQWQEQIQKREFNIKTYTPNNPEYNFVSPNREIYLNYGCDVWLDDKLKDIITSEELKVLSNNLKDNQEWFMLTADEYNKQKNSIRIELMNARRTDLENTAKTKFKGVVYEQFKKKAVTRKGITFKHTSIECNGIKIISKDIKYYLLDNNILIQELPVFNELWEGLIDFLLNLEPNHDRNYNTKGWNILFKGKTQIKIDKIKINLEKKGNLFYINDKKIIAEDLRQVIKNAISFNSHKEYDKWVEHISKTSLRVQKIIKDKSINFELRIDQTSDNCLVKEVSSMMLSLPVKREGNRNYITISGKEYKVKNTPALFQLGKDVNIYGGYLKRTIKLLYQAIENITPKDIGDLIRRGETEYKKVKAGEMKKEKDKIERSERFVNQAVKLTKAKKVNGGYFVKGLTKITYFVDEKNLQVYTIKKGKKDKYLCIVDEEYSWERENDKALINDRLAKRLLMLNKDKKVAKTIYDNGDGLDQHWNQIQDEMPMKENTGVII